MRADQIHPEKPWPDPPERETATMKAMTAEERLSMMRAFASGALASFADEAYKAVALLRRWHDTTLNDKQKRGIEGCDCVWCDLLRDTAKYLEGGDES